MLSSPSGVGTFSCVCMCVCVLLVDNSACTQYKYMCIVVIHCSAGDSITTAVNDARAVYITVIIIVIVVIIRCNTRVTCTL